MNKSKPSILSRIVTWIILMIATFIVLTLEGSFINLEWASPIESRVGRFLLTFFGMFWAFAIFASATDQRSEHRESVKKTGDE